MKSTSLLIIVATLATSQANSRLEIQEVSGVEYTTNLRCVENFFNGEPDTLLHNISLFLYNDTSQLVVTLLEDNDVQYVFDDNSDGTLRFNARQDIEGYYYCSRDMSAGVPDNEDLYTTVLACPIDRQAVQTTYTVPVGGSVTLLSGVGPGALREHYRGRWFRGFHTEATRASIIDGDDFSLQMGSLQLSDTDIYYSVVEVCDLSESPCPMNPRCSSEHETHITLTVYGIPTIEWAPESIVVAEMDSESSSSFTCVATGEPSLKVSWFRGETNLSSLTPPRYEINEINNGTGITSVLTINNPTYEDSGDYSCIGTDKIGDAEFTAYSNAILIVVESDFLLNTVVTEHKHLQLWVELNAPLIAEVRAIVYFTPSHDRNMQYVVTTRSVLTANPVMVFQLESQEIPYSVREDDFLVQVALSVDGVNGSKVPRQLEDASTLSVITDQSPTSTAPSEQSFSSTIALALSATVGLVILAVLVVTVIMFYYYKKKKLQGTDTTHDQNNNLRLDTVPENQYFLGKAKESQQLHEQLKDKRMIISKDQLHLTSIVGQGESGLVYRGYMDTSVGSELVAVKTGKALFSSGDFERLTKEISTMLNFEHPNVMSLVGVCVDGEIPLLIMPFMSNGSILEYVRHHKQELLLTSESTDEEVQSVKKTYLKMCHQITKGMTYLAKNKFVHRDLAARNCMIDGCGVIKVADFGLTEDMYATKFFRRDKTVTECEEKVPIRWMTPESIENNIYNESTDVWSFGVTVWELFTCGSVPYSGIPVVCILRALKAGQRLDKPDNAACSNEIYDMMTSCWNLDFRLRPKFANLQCVVSGLLEVAAGYMELSCSLNWKKEEELEDRSTTALIPMEMIDEVEEAAADLCLTSTQDTPM